jgi:hypothetical protein
LIAVIICLAGRRPLLSYKTCRYQLPVKSTLLPRFSARAATRLLIAAWELRLGEK